MTTETNTHTNTDRPQPRSRRRLDGLHLGSPREHGPLTIFPIWTEEPIRPRRHYATSTRTMPQVSETDPEPQVDRLQATHSSHRPLVMFGGAMLEAGWQHRVLLRDMAVAPGQVGMLEVACVEAHRWGSGTQGQRTGQRRAPLTVRGAAFGIRPEDAGRFAAARHRQSDQGDVWRRVSYYERAHGASRTSSLVDVASRFDNEVAELTAHSKPLPAQRGVLIGLGGHPVLLEVFDHPRTLAEEWTAILGSVWLDARDRPAVPTPGYRARAFLGRTNRPSFHDLGPAGAGQEVAVEDLSLFTGRGLLLDGDLVHASVLNLRHELVLAA